MENFPEILGPALSGYQRVIRGKAKYIQLFNQFEGSDMFSTSFQKYAGNRWLVGGKISRNLIND